MTLKNRLLRLEKRTDPRPGGVRGFEFDQAAGTYTDDQTREVFTAAEFEALAPNPPTGGIWAIVYELSRGEE